jgi:hypothetical protein
MRTPLVVLTDRLSALVGDEHLPAFAREAEHEIASEV